MDASTPLDNRRNIDIPEGAQLSLHCAGPLVRIVAFTFVLHRAVLFTRGETGTAVFERLELVLEDLPFAREARFEVLLLHVRPKMPLAICWMAATRSVAGGS